MRRVRLDPWLLAFHLAVVYTSDYVGEKVSFQVATANR